MEGSWVWPVGPRTSSLEASGSGLWVVWHVYSTFGAVQLQSVLRWLPWPSGQGLPSWLWPHVPW